MPGSNTLDYLAMTLSIMMLSIKTSIIMPSDVYTEFRVLYCILSVVTLSVVMLSAVASYVSYKEESFITLAQDTNFYLGKKKLFRYHIMILVYFTVGSTSSGSAFVIAPNLGTKTIFESISL